MEPVNSSRSLFIIVYRIHREEITIVSVFHGKQKHM